MAIQKSGQVRKKNKPSSQHPKEDFIRMNVNIPKSFHKKIKQKALDEDSTITEIVVNALNKYISE
jgi:hypothetical protein